MADADLIYKPAKRRGVGVLIMLAGASGSGKTLSALKLATGLAEGGTIGFCDTEHGRALMYADDFEFQHLEMKEPFRPKRFEDAAIISQEAGHKVWICDSFSHEHTGPGGLLDYQEEELQKLTRGDFSKRDALKYTSWIAPKMEHKHMLQRLYQLNAHIILCCQAAKKLELIKDHRGRNVPNPDAQPVPICGEDIPYAMTFSLMFDGKEPGVPRWLKRFEKIEPLINFGAPIDVETGKRIAAWARGDAVEPAQQTQREQPREAGRTQQQARPAQQPPAMSDELREQWVEAARNIAADFLDAADRQAYTKIIDDEGTRNDIAELKKALPDVFKRELEPIMKAAWERTAPPKAEATTDPQPQEETMPQ